MENLKKTLVFLVLALVGWALCGLIVFVGRMVTDMQTTLIVHAIGAPIIFFAIAYPYFTRVNYTRPLLTAALFVAIVIGMDFFVVAMQIEKSMDMFRSFLGTWLPFILIFLSTYLTGLFVERRAGDAAA